MNPALIRPLPIRATGILVAFLLALVVLGAGAQNALAAGPGTLVDSGFEAGAEGALLASPPWSAVGSPQHREYDNARARNGAQSAWIQGPAVASYAGAAEAQSANMTADGSEIRFWVYQDTTNQLRRFYDNIAAGATYGTHLVLLGSDGTIQVNVAKASPPAGYTTGYTTVGTQATGWTQYRLVFNFTNQTYTLSTRTTLYGAWTQLKSAGAPGYDIPMRGSGTVTRTGGVAFSAQLGASLWLDDVVFSETGISDSDTTPPGAPAALLATDRPGDAGGAIDLSWTAASDNVAVTGYKLYRGTSAGVYGAPVVLGNVTAYTDATALTGTRYYYAVSALDAAGNEGAKSPEASAIALDNSGSGGSTGTLVDSGFEAGAEGALLASPPWSAVGSPQHREYDNARARNGAQSAWIQGPAVASYAGAAEAQSANMTADGSEIRFWVYQDTTNQLRRFYDNIAAGATYGTHLVLLGSDGTIQVNVAKASPPAGYTTGYTTVGTQATGWTQYRLVFNFTNQTYTLSTRTTLYGAWTQLKSAGAPGFDIPMRGSGTVTRTGGVAFSAQLGASLWLDDVVFSETGIVDGPAGDTTPPGAPAALLATDRPGDAGGAIDLSWTAASDNVAVTGYKLYRGTSAGVYGAPVVLGNVTAYTDATALTGTRYYYAVSALDAAGNEGAKSPEANAVALDNTPPAAADMPITAVDCSNCHAGLDHGDGPNCGDCHDISEGHPGTPSDMHIPAVVTTCTPCHNSSLTVEHNGRTPDAGGTFVCNTCHESTDPLVTSAIAASNSACSACHPSGGGHEAQHVVAENPCASCHAGTSLTTVHLSGGTMTCDDCHKSKNPIVINAIDTHQRECSACHIAEGVDYHPNVNTAHISPTTSTCFGVGCHPQSKDVRDVHALYVGPKSEFPQYDDTCALCHENQTPGRIDWTRATAACTDVCHATPTHSQYNSLHAATSASDACKACHTESLSGIHGAEADLTKCATCHADVANWSKSGDCASCHTPAPDHESMHVTTLATDCAGCHKPSISSEHARPSSSSAAKACDSCHPTPRNTFAAWDKSCAQGGCHVVGTQYQQHAQIDAKHNITGSGCLGADCHSGTLTELHSEASTTTPSGTYTGCNVCHTTETVPATTDCATCHPDRVEPHGYDAAKHTATIGANTASGSYTGGGTYSVRCDACHGVELGPEHLRTSSSSAAARCSNCHPLPADDLTPSWAKGCVQNGCHPAGTDGAQHGLMTAAHSQPAANAECTGSNCHNGGDLADVHKDAPGECLECHSTTSVPATKVCTVCHGTPHGDLTVKHTAAEPGAMTWAGTSIDPEAPDFPKSAPCTQCHYLDIRAEHAKASSGSLACNACHKDGGPVDLLPESGWNGKCSACHTSVHSQYDVAHVAYAQDNCTGCHDYAADVRTYHRSCGAAAPGAIANPAAGSCHVSPAAPPTTNYATETYWWCRSCHPNE